MVFFLGLYMASKLNCSQNLLLLLCCLIFRFANAADNITTNQFITDGMTLVSNGGVFALGFFSPGKSSKRYVGIWYNNYNKLSQQKVVWVANREHPIEDTTGVLKIKAGNLSIFHGINEQDPVWSTNVVVSTTAKHSFAKLLDSGNLVLFQEDDNSDRYQVAPKVVWESFDYPTNTWLPGMKFGVDKRTGLNRILVSWKSSDDPAPGHAFLGLDLKGLPQFMTYVGSVPYWGSGPWSSHGLAGVPEIPNSTDFNFTFVNNQEEIYLVSTPYNAYVLHHFLLDEFGVLHRVTWIKRTNQWAIVWSTPRDRCDVYGQCGVYGKCSSNSKLTCICLPGYKPKFLEDWILRDGSEGCVAKRNLICGEGEGFLKVEHVKIPDTSKAQFSPGMDIKECEMECLRNCSCTAYSITNINQLGIGCVAWYGDLLDIREYPDGGDDIYIRVDAIEIANSRKNSSRISSGGSKKILVIVSAVVVSVILQGILFRYTMGMKKANVKGLDNKEKLRQFLVLNDFLSANQLEEAAELPFFDLDVIMEATCNFSDLNKIGQGGFGPVYKGRLSSGQDVAVKRLSVNSSQGIEELKNEVLLIAKLQHRNLVRLLGVCIEGEEKILIYEYMPNKSLDFFIFDQIRSAILLDWTKRFNIIVGIARGVLYLHQDSRFRIIHRDLKASNVLLDADMNPKISDFGLARIFEGNQTRSNTKKVVGTYGYMAPEYAINGLFSIKSDVFSFGVLLLEIISGKKNRGYYHDNPSSNIIGHAWDLWKEGKALELVDPLMENCYPLNDVLRCIQVGLLCVQGKASDRPTMTTIVTMLGMETKIANPKPPAYVMTTLSTSDTLNDVTITTVEAR